MLFAKRVSVFPPPFTVMFPPVTLRLLVVVPPDRENPSAFAVRESPLTVLFVRASDPARVESVPVVGSVTLVSAVVVRVSPNAPEVVNEEAVVSAPPSDVVCPFNSFALMVPVPVKLKEAPFPTTIEAVVFVPLVIAENDGLVTVFATQEGGDPDPLLWSTYPDVPGVREVKALAEEAYKTPFVVKPAGAKELVTVIVLLPVSADNVMPVPPVSVRVSLPDAVILFDPIVTVLNVSTEGTERVLLIVVPFMAIPLPAVRVTAPVCP